MKRYIQHIFLMLCFLSLSGVVGAQGIVDPEGPSDPTTGKVITVIQTEGGRITPQGEEGKVTVLSGEDQTFVIMADEGYEIGSVAVDGTELSIQSGLPRYSHTLYGITDNNRSITATFIPVRFTLTAKVSEGGSITPSSAEIGKGKKQLFTIVPVTGFEIADVRINGVSVGAISSYTFENVEKDGEIEASFKRITYTVTLAETSNGNLNVQTTEGDPVTSGENLPFGTLLVLTATPDEGYTVDKLKAGSLNLPRNTYKVTGDITLSASFKKAVCTVTIGTVSGGILTVKNGYTSLLTGTHSVEYGTVLSLENKAAIGYSFTEYQVTPVSSLGDGRVTITTNVSIGAVFTPQKYKVTMTASEASEGKFIVNGSEAVTGEKEYPYNTELTLENIPAAGKVFDSYLVSPASSLIGNRLKVTGNLSLAIRFKNTSGGGEETDPEDGKKMYSVTYSSPLIVKEGETTVRSGTRIKEGTLLSLVLPNTNTQRLVSLAANGNPVEFLTVGGLNNAMYEVVGPVTFTTGLSRNVFPVLIQTPDEGTLQATVGGVPVTSGDKYDYGTTVSVTAIPTNGYVLNRVLAGMQDITLSKQIVLTEDLILSAIFAQQGNISPAPDPSNPDPGSPAGIDLSPQSVIYNGKNQDFELKTMPGGIIDKVAVTYSQNGKKVKPLDAGLYDVMLFRPADERFAALDQTIPGGLEIKKAPVIISDIKYEEEQVVGNIARTMVILKGGKTICQSKEVKGTFSWSDPSAVGNELTVTTSGYQEVYFTPDDKNNYLSATGQVYIRVVGDQPTARHSVTMKIEGKGKVTFYNGDLLCSGTGPFYHDMSLTFLPQPEPGNRFAGFMIDGVLYNADPYTVTLTKDLIVTARFTAKSDPLDPDSPLPIRITIEPPVDLFYNGKPRLATISSVPALTGWQVEYRNKENNPVIPVDAGTYQVIVSREEDDIYLACRQTSLFTIAKATPVISELPVANAISKGAPLEDAELKGGVATAVEIGKVPGSFLWNEPKKNVVAEEMQAIRFTPSDPSNFYSVAAILNVPLIAIPSLVRIEYGQSTGGTLTVTNEETGASVLSGTLVASGTRIRIKMTANPYFRFGSLFIGGADYTGEVLNGNGTVVRAMFTPAQITGTFVRTSYPPDPDPNPDPNPDPAPDPVLHDYTVWIRSTGLGTVFPETSQVKQGEDLTITITPGHSQQLVDVRLNGNSVGAVTEYRLRNIQGEATIEAVFSNQGIPVYTLFSRTVGKGGYVTPELVRVAEGSNHQFVIHTDYKGTLDDVQIGTKEKMQSVGIIGSYIFRNVRADSVIVASFGQATGLEILETGACRRLYTIANCLYAKPSSSESTLFIYTLTGQLVFRQRLTGQFVYRNLLRGVYIAELKDGTSIIREKIMIEH